MKKYLSIFIVCVVSLTIFLIIVLKPTSETDIESFVDTPQQKVKAKARNNAPSFEKPIVDQEIKRINIENDITNLKAGFARVKIKLTKEAKTDLEKDFEFKVVVYQNHQEIYRAEKVKNQYLGLQFKIDETYQFYIFKENKMAFLNVKIVDEETVLLCEPKANIKKVIIKNDYNKLFTEFKLGCFKFNTGYSFSWLNNDAYQINEYCVFPDMTLPEDYQNCQLQVSSSYGFFTIIKSFEEIFNDQPLKIELPILKEINVKITKDENQNDFNLYFIPENFILLEKESPRQIQMNITNQQSSFFTNLTLCEINLIGENILLSKTVVIKDAVTYLEFNLSETALKQRKIIVKNNPFGDKLHLYRSIDSESTGNGLLGKAFGIPVELKLVNTNEYEYPSKNSFSQESLLFYVSNGETDSPKEKNKNYSFLGVDFFKGNLSETIEIDFNKQKFFPITLKRNSSSTKPVYLVSLNERFVLEIQGADDQNEHLLYLKKGSYRVFEFETKTDFFFGQSFEVSGEAIVTLTNEFEQAISPVDSVENIEDTNLDGLFFSCKSELPSKPKIFQVLKSLNCLAQIKAENKYNQIDLSYTLWLDEEKTILLKPVKNSYSYLKDTQEKSLLKYTPINLNNELLNHSQILFSKSFAPSSSEINFINLSKIFISEVELINRRVDDNFPCHIFLSNFEYLILPPLNKPNIKIQTGFYGKVLINFSNPNHHLFSFEIIGENNQIINTQLPDYHLLDNHTIYLDNISNGNCIEFNFLEFGSHLLEVSDLTTGVIYKYPFQVSEKYQEIEVK